MNASSRDHSGNGKKSTLTDATFSQIANAIRDYAIFLLDPSGNVASWNEGAEAITGYTPADILGSHFSRFYPPEQVNRGWPQFELERAAEDGRFEDESWRVRKDGSRFWANVVITALRDPRGKLIGFAKVTRDLTERRSHEELLRQNEERFRALVQDVKDYAIFLLDPGGLVASWNIGAEKLTGYISEEIVGSHFSRFYTADAIRRRWPEHELRTATMEGRFEDEGWRVRKDGSRFWANVVITALRDRSGQLIGFSKITRDLTERKKHEQQIAESEARFRLLVEGVSDYAIVMLDHAGTIGSWNSGAEAITGHTAAQMLGKHLSHLYVSEDVHSSKPWQHLLLAHENGRITEEGWRLRRDGAQFWAAATISALHDHEHKHRGYVCVMQDLTQRRHAEALADTTKRMHEFIAMLAHELRNPLAPIRNAVELMARKGLGDPTLEAMRATIERQTTLLARIIDELLDVNRIARGQLAIERGTVDLRNVLLHAIEASRPSIDTGGHRLSVDLPDEPLIVQGDAMRLTQAIVNLLNNAARYTPPGGEIRLLASKRDTDVVIRVRDTGKGIAPHDLERIFDLFTQVDAREGAQHGGLGVGLALVRRVIELHAGSVRAHSDGAGRGSEFVIRLPLPIEHPELVADNEPLGRDTTLPRLRILVVDDNKDAADSLQLLLQALGQDVYAVYDGRTALSATETFRPHVVMLDIGMPGMSGYEVADALRTGYGDGAPVLVAITGWGQETDREHAKSHGFVHHFTKPLGASALHEFLETVGAPRLTMH
jgi:PAS domain S-box-containing protein